MELRQIITGAAGFIGSHLCRTAAESLGASAIATLDLVPADPSASRAHLADIRRLAMLTELARRSPAPVVVHLAALAEAVQPFGSMRDLTATNVEGTINVLQAFDPARLVFASSSAVYGTLRDRRARPIPGDAAATGAYGVSKLMGEAICSQWAGERKASVVSLRLGNVVGPRCRGLIPYLVGHAIRRPDGSLAALLRGGGRIIRDYVTVECVVETILKSLELPLEAGRVAIINVGSGTGMSNGEVAQLVAAVLEGHGYRLRLDFDHPLAPGESASVVLDVEEMTSRLGVRPPDRETVVRSIEQATLAHLETMRSAPS